MRFLVQKSTPRSRTCWIALCASVAGSLHSVSTPALAAPFVAPPAAKLRAASLKEFRDTVTQARQELAISISETRWYSDQEPDSKSGARHDGAAVYVAKRKLALRDSLNKAIEKFVRAEQTADGMAPDQLRHSKVDWTALLAKAFNINLVDYAGSDLQSAALLAAKRSTLFPAIDTANRALIEACEIIDFAATQLDPVAHDRQSLRQIYPEYIGKLLTMITRADRARHATTGTRLPVRLVLQTFRDFLVREREFISSGQIACAGLEAPVAHALVELNHVIRLADHLAPSQSQISLTLAQIDRDYAEASPSCE